MRAGAWVAMVLFVAACGDNGSGAPGDAAQHDGSSPADAAGGDGSSADAAAPGDAAPPVCDDDPGLPEPPTCAQTIPWAAYVGDEVMDGRPELFTLTMNGAPGEPAVASGGHQILLYGARETWSYAPGAGAVAFWTRDAIDQWRLYAAPITSAGPGEVREVSGPFAVDGNVTWWAWSPDGTKIVYVADQEQEGVPELWVMDLASAGPAQRVNAPFDGPGGFVDDFIPMLPAWSPDSSMILFRAGRNLTVDDELYIADVSGPSPSPPAALTLGTDDTPYRAIWAPNSRTVAFYTGGSLSVARVACGAIVDGPHLVASLVSFGEQLSPEGDELIYLGRIDADSAALYRADLTVTPPASTQISEPGGITFDSTLAWSPTAPRVAFRTDRRLEVLDGASGARSIVNGPLVAGGRVFRFAWSPDGQSIAYIANQLDASQAEVFHVDMSGTGPRQRRRVSLPAAHQLQIPELRWSGDSSHLAYEANQEEEARIELYATSRADGVMGAPVRLNPPLQRDGARVFWVSWSPDGSRLLYTSNDAGSGVSDAFVVGLEAPGDAAQINNAPDVFQIAWAPCPAP